MKSQLNRDITRYKDLLLENLSVIILYAFLQIPLVIIFILLVFNIPDWVAILILIIGWQIFIASCLFVVVTMKLQLNVKISKLKEEMNRLVRDDMK
jgi:hypothetical protein